MPVRVRMSARVTAVTALALAASTVLSSGADPARAITPGLVGAAAASSWQTNAPVQALAVTGGVLYVGGTFTSVRPPHDAPGQGEVARSGLAAFDAATGALLRFAPKLGTRSGSTLSVSNLTVSPDGATLYVGGNFTSVNGVQRTAIAAFSTSTQALTSWSPGIAGGYVDGIAAATNGAVYFGGGFSTVAGQARHNAAAADAQGRLLPWAPSTNAVVRTMVLSPRQGEVVIGGTFSRVDGAAHQGIIAVDRATGATVPAWRGGPQLSTYFQVFHMAGDAQQLYIGGVDYSGSGPAEFDGTAALDWQTGTVVWADRCQGDTRAVAVLGGILYSGSHSHNCSRVAGGFPNGSTRHHLLAERTTDGEMQPWFPNTNAGPDYGDNGPAVLATDGKRLFVGGDFTTVNGAPQEGLTRFGSGPDRTPPTAPGTPAATVAAKASSTSPGVVDVKVTAGWDTDDGTLTYSLYRDAGTSPVATTTADSRFWSKPSLTLTDSSAPAGQHSYRVVASDGTSSRRSALSNTVTT